MAAKCIIAVVKDNDYKIAQYSTYNATPLGQGLNILKFFNNHKYSIVTFSVITNNLEWITNDDLINYLEEFGLYKKNANLNKIHDKIYKKYPQLDPDSDKSILELVFLKGIKKVKNDIDFANDSLHCEWLYLINFDDYTFEIYKGFNKKKLTPNDRFYNDTEHKEYYPVKKIKSYSLYNLPSIEKFTERFSKYE